MHSTLGFSIFTELYNPYHNHFENFSFFKFQQETLYHLAVSHQFLHIPVTLCNISVQELGYSALHHIVVGILNILRFFFFFLKKHIVFCVRKCIDERVEDYYFWTSYTLTAKKCIIYF